jgi:uncharacterized protein (TIGR03437 family)
MSRRHNLLIAAPILVTLAACAPAASAATIGTVSALIGGASDLVLDETRGQVYLVQPQLNYIQIYTTKNRQYSASPIATDQEPLSAALGLGAKYLYVACYGGSVLDVVDLTALSVTARISLPASPEGVAVDSKGRVLISTTGSTGGSNLLLLYDPSVPALSSIPVTLAAPAAPTFPPASGRPFLASHSQLRATRNGSYIAGLNAPATGSATLFVYEAASSTVLRSRILAGASTALAISDDGTRILSGPVLFDATTLQVLAQMNAGNILYAFNPSTSFTTQANQGGAVFSPDGTTLYAVFDILPIEIPALTGSVSQLMLNDPNNLLVHMGIQLPENFDGKMVISADGTSMYGLSDSGLTAVPVGTIAQSPIAVPSAQAVIVTGDECGVTAQTASATVNLTNGGKGSFTASAQVLRYTGQANPPSTAAAPTVRPGPSGGLPQFAFGFNSGVKTDGTVTPPDDILIQSNEAINIPNTVRVFENYRDPEARGTLVPIAAGPTLAQPFPDIVYDQPRQLLYIANAGLNQVEIFNIATQSLMAPIKVGQLPTSLALTPDGLTLYVGNSGGESISIVDPSQLAVVGQVQFPPIPFNSTLALETPTAIAAGLSGLQILTSDGTLWTTVGNTAVPRAASPVIGTTATGQPAKIPVPSSMAATPGGDFILLATNTGIAYLYDATLDEFVTGRTIFTGPQTGYVGPATAGPSGQYYMMNGALLNSQLETITTGTGISAVAAAGSTSVAVFSPSSTAAPTVSMLNPTNGSAGQTYKGLEGPLTPVTTGRGTIGARTMVVDPVGNNAYVITASGLSVIPLTAIPASGAPQPSRGGAVNLGSYQPAIAANGLLSIFGQNLAQSATAPSTPLPQILGGVCVTLAGNPLPLFATSATQINAQIPPNTAAGSAALVVHSIANHIASSSQNISVSKYAPAVLVSSTGQIMLFHQDGSYVTVNNPAVRDEPLTMYAVGLGATTGGAVTAGEPSPSSPLAVSAPVNVYFGNPSWVQAGIIVDWSGLAPGMIGVYQLNLRVPGFHISGNALPVMLTIGGVNSPTTGPVVPNVAVN